MAGEKFKKQIENSLEAENESKLREAARDYWLRYHLSRLRKDSDAGVEIAREAYERHLEKIENLGMLPSQKITEIVREIQKEAREEAKIIFGEEEKRRISELN